MDKNTQNTMLAAGGMAAGTAVGGPIGGMIGGAVLPQLGGAVLDMFGLGGSDPVADAEAKKMAAMQQAAQAYRDYRPLAMQARQQGLQQQLSAYGGAENALAQMYGSQADPRVYAPNLGKLPNPEDYRPPAPAPAPAPEKKQDDSWYLKQMQAAYDPRGAMGNTGGGGG